MKVFISWSEARSRVVAEALHGWLPTIIQPVRPWMSEHDIDKGTRGLPAIARQLDATQFGIICLTPENLGAPWLLFEAGALSKGEETARVWTLLYDLEYVGVQGPLAQFQHTKAEKEDVRKLLTAINTATGAPLITEEQLRVAFDRGWPELEEKLRAIPAPDQVHSPQRSVRELVEESLTLLRKIAAREGRGFTDYPVSAISAYTEGFSPAQARHWAAYLLDPDNTLRAAVDDLESRFELVRSGSVPPADLRHEADTLLRKVRATIDVIDTAGINVPSELRALYRRMKGLHFSIRRYVTEERQQYDEADSTASES